MLVYYKLQSLTSVREERRRRRRRKEAEGYLGVVSRVTHR